MPAWKAYPTVKDMPSRKQRKGRRKTVFYENQMLMNTLRKERRLARKKAREEAAE